jgi:hypothetical protein
MVITPLSLPIPDFSVPATMGSAPPFLPSPND